MNKLKQKNYLTVIASGRAPFEIEEITKESTINSYVSLNGQYVVAEEEVVANHRIETNLVKDVLTFAENLGHPVSCYTSYDYRINFIDAAAKKLYALDNASLPVVDPNYYATKEINMLYLFSEETEHDTILKEKFTDTLTFYRDSPFSMAIVNKNRSKNSGITELLNHLNLADVNNTYAFGDGENDLSMFDAVTYSIAMANATEIVKKKATFVTHTHESDGIEFALKEFHIL